MGIANEHKSRYLLASLMAATQACSNGIETATSNGTSSGQGIVSNNGTSNVRETTASTSDSQASVTGGNRKSASNGDPSASGGSGNNIASVPGNIAGSNNGDLGTGGSGGLAVPPLDVGGGKDAGSAGSSRPTTAESGAGVSTITGLKTQDGVSSDTESMPAVVSSDNMDSVRWTDTGDASKLSIHCIGTMSFGGSVWQGDCTVVTPTGLELDLVHETSSRKWTVTSGVGCNPQQYEEASFGAITYMRLLYVGPVIATCVPSTTVKLQAKSHRGQSFTLVRTLTR